MPTLSEFIGAENLRQQQENEQLANNIMNYMNVMYQAQAGREAKQAERQYKAQEELNKRQFELGKIEYTKGLEKDLLKTKQDYQKELLDLKTQQALALEQTRQAGDIKLEQTRQAGDIKLEQTKEAFKAGQVKPATTSFMNAKANYESALSEFDQFKKNNLSGGYFVFGENKYVKKDGEWYKVTATGKIGGKEKAPETIKYLNTKDKEYLGIKNKQKQTANLYNQYLQSGSNVSTQPKETTTDFSLYLKAGE